MKKPMSTQADILVVEARQDTANSLATTLAERGYRARTAAAGAQALALVQDLSPDILLLSDRLPDMEARELCSRVLTGESRHNLQILVLSDTRDPTAIAGLLEAGASDVLIEPSNEQLLLSRIEMLLAIAQMRNEIARRDHQLEEEATTRRKVEEDVRAAELSGRELMENLSEVIYTTSADGVLTYVSPGIERLLGYTPEKVTGRHVRDFVHPEAHDRLNARMQQVLAGHRVTSEYRLLTTTGESRWAYTSSQPIYADGQVIGLQGVLTDVTERKQAEEQIRQQNEFLTTVLESLTHPFYVIDVEDYSVKMANSAARLDTVMGLATCYALTHHRDAPCSSAAHPCPLEELRKTGKPVTVEHVHFTPEGEERFVEVHSYPLFDTEGNVVRAIEYTLDITDRKEAEAALRESEARWRSLTERSPDHVILVDTELRIEFLNYASPGLTVEELIGTPLYSYVQEERRQEIREILERVLTTSEPASYETYYSAPGGSTIYYESRAVPRSIEGRVVGLAVNARDISEHKRIEQALRDAKEAAEQARQAEQERRREADQRRRVAESLGGVMAALNSNQPLHHVLDHIAAQARELLDNEEVAIYAAGAGGELVLQVAQGPLHTHDDTTDRACSLRAVEQALRSRRPVAIESPEPVSTDGASQSAVPFQAILAVPVIVKDELYGSMVMCSAEPRSFSTEEIELASVFGDQVALAVEGDRLRSELKQAAADAERNRLARDLHDSVSQALFSSSLVAEVLPKMWERNPQLAQEGLQELRSLNRGALAEMRTMLLELRPTAVLESRLTDLVRQMTEAITSRAEMLVTYDIEPSPTLPPDIHIAFYRIAQEALNNVLKHAGASHVKVSLHATPPLDLSARDDWSGQMTLEVTDDGQGFEQTAPGPDRLGLGIMRERAEAVGAKLGVDSVAGVGTRITLVWPRDKETD